MNIVDIDLVLSIVQGISLIIFVPLCTFVSWNAYNKRQKEDDRDWMYRYHIFFFVLLIISVIWKYFSSYYFLTVVGVYYYNTLLMTVRSIANYLFEMQTACVIALTLDRIFSKTPNLYYMSPKWRKIFFYFFTILFPACYFIIGTHGIPYLTTGIYFIISCIEIGLIICLFLKPVSLSLIDKAIFIYIIVDIVIYFTYTMSSIIFGGTWAFYITNFVEAFVRHGFPLAYIIFIHLKVSQNKSANELEISSVKQEEA
uniref:Uncharacterized protein n=1 Tax=Lepeophtheirus salmonis TaxID=72036 RepID=A0A0K2UUI1_LEPSM